MIDLCMSFDLLFNKPVDKYDIGCRPGGYEIITRSGDIYDFDFEEVESDVDSKDDKVVHFKCSMLDLDTYSDMRVATWDDIEDIQDFVEFYAETSWDKEYIPVGVRNLTFESGFVEFTPNDEVVSRISNVIS